MRPTEGTEIGKRIKGLVTLFVLRTRAIFFSSGWGKLSPAHQAESSILPSLVP